MNERIKELKDQCWVEKHWDNGMWVEKHIDQEKFAELIVQKCADIGQQYADGNYEVRNQIMAHFGLEEE